MHCTSTSVISGIPPTLRLAIGPGGSYHMDLPDHLDIYTLASVQAKAEFSPLLDATAYVPRYVTSDIQLPFLHMPADKVHRAVK